METQAGQIQAPEIIQSCHSYPGIHNPTFPVSFASPHWLQYRGDGGHSMSPAALHQMPGMPSAHDWTSQSNATDISHFQTLTSNAGSPVSQGGGHGGWKSSHLLTILLSLLACGIVESSPFTLILVGDCTLRCSGSMDCWQVDMGT